MMRAIRGFNSRDGAIDRMRAELARMNKERFNSRDGAIDRCL